MVKHRSRVTARVVSLDSREAADPRMGGTIDERVAAVAVLTAEAWSLAGRPLPQYTRAAIPVIVTPLLAQGADDPDL
jgi:hypothetical protein